MAFEDTLYEGAKSIDTKDSEKGNPISRGIKFIKEKARSVFLSKRIEQVGDTQEIDIKPISPGDYKLILSNSDSKGGLVSVNGTIGYMKEVSLVSNANAAQRYFLQKLFEYDKKHGGEEKQVEDVQEKVDPVYRELAALTRLDYMMADEVFTTQVLELRDKRQWYPRPILFVKDENNKVGYVITEKLNIAPFETLNKEQLTRASLNAFLKDTINLILICHLCGIEHKDIQTSNIASDLSAVGENKACIIDFDKSNTQSGPLSRVSSDDEVAELINFVQLHLEDVLGEKADALFPAADGAALLIYAKSEYAKLLDRYNKFYKDTDRQRNIRGRARIQRVLRKS